MQSALPGRRSVRACGSWQSLHVTPLECMRLWRNEPYSYCHFDNYNNEGTRRQSYARTIYSDCTVEMDEILGRLVRTLYETGQAESTLVFFTSDNGPEDEIAPHGHTPFRGGKGDTWEGGVRVPGIAWWPGMIEPRQSDGLFDLADLYTTFTSLAGFNYAQPKDPQLASQLKDRYLYGVNLPVSYLWMFNVQADPKEKENINIRHLWAQHLFSGELTRFMCDLVVYPPNLPTQPEAELMAQQQIQLLKGHPESWKDACGSNVKSLNAEMRK